MSEKTWTHKQEYDLEFFLRSVRYAVYSVLLTVEREKAKQMSADFECAYARARSYDDPRKVRRSLRRWIRRTQEQL